MEYEIRVNKIYRHFKGGTYRVIAIAKDSETEQDVVVYENTKTNQVWVRPLKMFLEKVDKEKYPDVNQEYRFERLLPISPNPDLKKVAEIKSKIKENDGYCPCQLLRNSDTRCMCKEFRESNKPGYCHCGLYYRAEE